MINEPRIDLACGNNKIEGFKGIDVEKGTAADYIVDLQQFPWPIESESAEEVHCSHYIEHIKHDNVALDLKSVLDKSNSFEEFKANINSTDFLKPRDGFIKFMNELYRILKPGGKVTLIAPYYSSMRAFGDPTHQRYMCDFSFYYYNKQYRDSMGLTQYGIDCDFDVKYSYVVSNELTLKSDDVRQKAFLNDLNTVDDIIVELIKHE